LQEKIENG